MADEMLGIYEISFKKIIAMADNGSQLTRELRIHSGHTHSHKKWLETFSVGHRLAWHERRHLTIDSFYTDFLSLLSVAYVIWSRIKYLQENFHPAVCVILYDVSVNPFCSLMRPSPALSLLHISWWYVIKCKICKIWWERGEAEENPYIKHTNCMRADEEKSNPARIVC